MKEIKAGCGYDEGVSCAMLCLVLVVYPGWLGSRGVSPGSVPGGKSIRASGGGDVPHSAIW